ncbi:hypothetical protein ERN12_06565 [Rhodobacteraceae bacterium]|nr:hypothetical protein ERN12_06565 [Paracoccaceae bacterium]
MRAFGYSLPVFALLCACAPQMPNSLNPGGLSQDYLVKREAQLQGQPVTSITGADPTRAVTAAPQAGAAAPLDATHLRTRADAGYTNDPNTAAPRDPVAQLGADTLDALNKTAPAGARVSSSAQSQPAQADVTPPPVMGQAGPNLVAYALQVTNKPGEAVYRRGGIKFTSTQKACAKYASADRAQRAFLTKGGPDKDPENLDPDGDGFACAWKPASFQVGQNG